MALGIGVSSHFRQMSERRRFEGLCMMMIEDPDLMAEMAAFRTDFVANLLDLIFKNLRGIFDFLHIRENMAYKAKTMISPEMTREFCKPARTRWSTQCKADGAPVIDMDSDGFIGKLIPIRTESGFDACDPIEVAAHNDTNAFRKEFGHKIAYRGGVHRRAMAKGGVTIRAELRRIEPIIKEVGFLPSCDHGIASDVSWPNFADYSRLLAKMTGWL